MTECLDCGRARCRCNATPAKQPAPASTSPVKDHVLREVVNNLRDIAVKFHAAGQLRERLRGALEPLLAPASTGREATVKDYLNVGSGTVQKDAVSSLHASMGIGVRKSRPTPAAKRREIQEGQAVVLERVLAEIRKRARATPAWATAYHSAATAVELELAQVRRDKATAPVAARELDVEAERRELSTESILRIIADNTGARISLSNGDLDLYIAVARKAIEADRAARSAAQGTDAGITASPESAPVSTEQAGDAWISVEDRMPEAGKWVIVSHRTEYVNAPPQQSVSTALFDGAYWWNHGHHIYTPTHWQSMPAAPSPNNSPVGADKEPK